MKKIEIRKYFENFPVEPEKQLVFMENLHQKYPYSNFVAFFYLKFLQERTPKKYETLKSELLFFIPNRKVFHNCKLEYFTDEYFEVEEAEQEKPDEIAFLSEQLQQNIPKIKFDPSKHNAEIDLAELGEIEDVEFISETLAMVYAEQGYTGKAIQMLKKLIIQNPEKNTYFAALIEKVKNSVLPNQNLVE